LKNASPNSNPANPPLPPRLQELLESQNNGLDAAIGEEAIQRAHAYIAGIKAYRHHPATRNMPDAPVIWSEGTTKLRDYNPASPHAPVVLVIPSLINRYEILDLDIAPSFLRTMASAGFRPLVVDWDEPGNDELHFTLDDYTARLTEALEWITKNTGPQIHLLGYCMGGLLALALATLRRSSIKTMTLFATPWDFHQPDATTGHLFAELASEWISETETSGPMPVDIIQYLFALLQPFQAITKFVEFAALDPESIEARHFVLLEDWLNDGVPLPVDVARECIEDWYNENRTALLSWRIGGRVVDPRNLDMPCYVVVPGRDRIVPPESALPLVKLLPHTTLHEPMTGHIGMMASRTASHQIWKPFLHWLQEHA
jgi:polyhydroxyalkanoate synthase